jgi:hypothetical protein
MRLGYLFLYVLLILVCFEQCNYISYTPKSKRNRSLARPSALIFDRMVDFRIEQGGWPISRQDFIGKGIKYYEVFNNFPYQTKEFKIKDSNTMTFYFSEYIQDVERYKKTQKLDLNSYNGHVNFYKENGKFLWTIAMRR